MTEKKKKILIVEDEAHLREILKTVLMAHNFDILEAEEGGEAFELYSIAKPDLVIMDLLMPGEDGLVATKKIKAFDKDATIIILSAIDEAETKHLIKDFNIYAYVIKPYSMDQLIELIEKATTP